MALLLFLNVVMAEELIWSEEFDNPALPSWNINEGDRVSGINCKESIEVKNGMLYIKTFTKDGKHYTGIIDTAGKVEFKYGRIEIRAKLSDVAGTWSDAWLYSKQVTDIPSHGMEVDLFEHRLYDMYRKDISGVVNHTLHWDGYGANHKCAATDTPINKEAFNIYSLVWTKDEYKFYVNNKLTWTVSPVSDVPLFFVLSVEIGEVENWTQPMLDKYDNVTMIVDYIRYYR
jgi:beta-glucanase (GH16 family)